MCVSISLVWLYGGISRAKPIAETVSPKECLGETRWEIEADLLINTMGEMGASCPRPWTQPRPPLVAPSFGGWHMPAKARRLMDLAILDRCLALGVSPIHVSTDAAARTQIAAGFFADLNQSIARKPWTVGNVQAFPGGGQPCVALRWTVFLVLQSCYGSMDVLCTMPFRVAKGSCASWSAIANPHIPCNAASLWHV